ncbi:hypothetical protein [Longimicrobium sp.]|uniref:hypothetical protein n=1 Tax=Longimicrobium sp. TaxID=2029185 RepID=UPI002ED77DD4
MASRVHEQFHGRFVRRVIPLVVVLSGCGGDPPPDLGREKYMADKQHCESISDAEPAQKACMTYRGWPDGEYRR